MNAQPIMKIQILIGNNMKSYVQKTSKIDYIIAVILLLGITVYAYSEDKLNLTHTTSFVAYPQDANHNYPMIFGGKLLAEMDRCAGITTRRLLYNSPNNAKDAVTIAINNVKFHKSCEVKDLLFVTGKVIKLGEKSITIHVVVERETKDSRVLLTEAEYVFVSYDLEKKIAIPHGIILK